MDDKANSKYGQPVSLRTVSLRSSILTPHVLTAATAVLLLLVIAISFALHASILHKAENDITTMLLQHKGVHEYVQQMAHPEMKQLKSQHQMTDALYSPVLFSSSYMVRNMHELYNQERKKAGLSQLYYKMAADNPRNPVNQADEREKALIERFNRNRSLSHVEEIIEEDGEKYLYVAMPFLPNEPRCLACHGNRQDAPEQLQERYPDGGGFNEQVGRIRAIESLKAPLADTWTLPVIAMVSTGLFGLLLVGLGLVNYRLKDAVNSRTQQLNEQTEALLKNEERLRQSEKMDALGQLAGGVAHDFNNMLAGILGATELLTDEIGDDANALQYLRMIEHSADRASELSQSLLTFSRRSDLNFSPLNIHHIIEETARILERTVDKRVQIRLELIATQFTILGNETLIENALLNLGINAGKAMPQGGQLVFSTRNIPSDVSDADNDNGYLSSKLEITVSDTGCGISPQDLPHIFEPFFTTRNAGEGTGLGLSATYGAVKSHHGEITVQSREQHGTHFIIVLPVVPAPKTTVVNRKSTEGGNETILVVDDEPIVREMNRSLLRSLGYNVLVAQNGREAISLFKEQYIAIDMVILDMIMPEMNGSDCFFELRKIDPHIPVLIGSGFSDNEEIQRLKDAGLAGYISKPFRRADLAEKIRCILHSESR
ncbi:MAG: DUF3365 domain-containing protein [Deltaproteobacteria bacterium]|nr:DUF3365 domain-containing protein [Deltaproteobacteria bacterium]MBN2671441.1 DUF3365 domain-containing protein [Deltaproteobacteria bacterium]